MRLPIIKPDTDRYEQYNKMQEELREYFKEMMDSKHNFYDLVAENIDIIQASLTNLFQLCDYDYDFVMQHISLHNSKINSRNYNILGYINLQMEGCE